MRNKKSKTSSPTLSEERMENLYKPAQEEPRAEVRMEELVGATEDDEREWMPAPAKITIIQRDAPSVSGCVEDRSRSSSSIKLCHAVVVTSKSSLHDKGISFSRDDDDSPLRIMEIAPKGQFSSSTLASGMTVVAINGKFMTWKSPEAAMLELGLSEVVKVTCEDAPGKVYKKAYTMDAEAEAMASPVDLGVKFARKGDDYPLFVHDVDEGGPFQDLLPGMKVLAINGYFLTWESPELAFEALRFTQGPKATITVESVVETVNMMLHEVDMEMNESGDVYIRNVSSYSESCPCGLKKGMKVLVLNGHVCSQSISISEMIETNRYEWDFVAVDLDSQKLMVSEAMEQCIYGSTGDEDAIVKKLNKKMIQQTNTRSINEGVSQRRKVAGHVPYDEPHGTAASRQEIAGDFMGNNGASSSVDVVADKSILITRGNQLLTKKKPTSGIPDSQKDTENQMTVSEEPEDIVAICERATEHSTSKGLAAQRGKTGQPFFVHETDDESICFSLDQPDAEQSSKMIFSYRIKKVSNEDLGLILTQGHNGGIYVSTIREYSKFRTTGLKLDMRIESINGITCPNTMRVTTALINAIDGYFELAATFAAKPKSTVKHEIFFTEY